MGGWYDQVFPGGGELSVDFTDTLIPAPKNCEWYECKNCKVDLRSGRHKVDCTLGPDERQNEFERVSFILKQLFKSKGLSVRNGRESDE